jgi:mRNA interferase MazF
MEVARGDIVIAVLPGDYGKGRPALVVQADAFNPTHASIVVCPITSYLVEAPLFRLALRPSVGTGLKSTSHIMIDKMIAIKREKIDQLIGHTDSAFMHRVDHALKSWLGLD